MENRRYRILFILTQGVDPHAGGVQMSTCKLGRHFSERGYDVGIFSFAQEGHSDCKFGQLWTGVEPGGQSSGANCRALGDALAEFKPQIVINQMPYEHEIGKLLKSRKDFLLLGCLRNTLFSVKGNLATYVKRTAPAFLKVFCGSKLVRNGFLALHRRRHARDLARILETYDYFVMFGPPNLEELEYFLPGFDRNKIRLIPNSIPQVAESTPQKEKRLLWLGRVAHEQKQAGLILEVWRRVCEKLPDWQLDVVGDGPDRSEIERHVTETGLPRVNFHGRQVPDEYYRRAAIFFMTSSFEGFPNTLVEAQSYAAIPIIFDSYPVARWILDDGQSGFLIEPFDVEAMADRIVHLATHPERARFAENALESARRFHIDQVGKKWQELFETELPIHVKEHEIEPAA